MYSKNEYLYNYNYKYITHCFVDFILQNCYVDSIRWDAMDVWKYNNFSF